MSADAGGRLGGVSLPNGVATAYAYTADGQVAGVDTTRGTTDLVSDTPTYTDAGLLASRTTTSETQAYAWDALARLDQITTTPAGCSTGTAAQVGFDTAGRVSELGSTALSYDSAGQVSTAVRALEGGGQATTAFAFDAAGNRTGQTTTLTGTTTPPPAPDPASPTGSGTWAFSYNQTNQLTHVTGPGTSTDYGYDGTGLRAPRTTAAGREDFVWDITTSIPTLLVDGTHEYVYGDGTTPLWQVETGTGEVTYLHTDTTGSVVAATDHTGTVVASARYDAYGRRTTTAGPTPSRFGYAGEYTDPDTGLLYLRARYYDLDTAQFLTLDPLAEQTGNPYGYTAGNPLQFGDPTGLDWLQDASDWSAGFGDTVTFGGTAQIRRLINYTVWGEDSDLVDHCSDFYTWGSRGGIIANTGLFVLDGINLARAAWAARGIIAAGLRNPAAAATALARQGVGALRAATDTITTVISRPFQALGKAGKAARGATTACFTAGTLVLMADGRSRPIEKIRVGDHVLAADPATGTTGPRRVTRTYIHHNVPTWTLTLADGSTLTTTADHPFWIPGHGWTPTHTLQHGDHLIGPDGDTTTVDHAQPTGTTATVYNIEVDGLHTYYVHTGTHWTLVHNTCGPAANTAASAGDHIVLGLKAQGLEGECAPNGVTDCMSVPVLSGLVIAYQRCTE